jgi:hypothetical protein
MIEFITTDRPAWNGITGQGVSYPQRCVTSTATIDMQDGGWARVQTVTYTSEYSSGRTYLSVVVPVFDTRKGRSMVVRARLVRSRELALRVAQRVADAVASRYGVR